MSRDNPNRNRVFLGRLNPEARTRDVEKFFKDNGFSRLKDINIKLGYAFVVSAHCYIKILIWVMSVLDSV